MIDEYSRECLALPVERSFTSRKVLDALAKLFIRRGTPDYIRSDNGPEFTAKAVRKWLEKLEIKTLFIEPGNLGVRGKMDTMNRSTESSGMNS